MAMEKYWKTADMKNVASPILYVTSSHIEQKGTNDFLTMAYLDEDSTIEASDDDVMEHFMNGGVFMYANYVLVPFGMDLSMADDDGYAIAQSMVHFPGFDGGDPKFDKILYIRGVHEADPSEEDGPAQEIY